MDQTLFGTTKRAQSETRQSDTGMSDFYSGGGSASNISRNNVTRLTKATAVPEIIKVVTKDMIRSIKVPMPYKEAEAITLSVSDYKRIKGNANFRTTEAEHAQMATLRKEKELKEEQSEQRRKELAAIDTGRAMPLSDLDMALKNQNEKILVNAKLLLEEEEDDIKKLNEFILSAKCHAIRDAQIAEKALITAQMKHEERRLDELMEQKRVESLQRSAEQHKELRKVTLTDAQKLRVQIEEREMQRLIDHELREQEDNALLERTRRAKQLDDEAIAAKKAKHRQMMVDVGKSNEKNLIEKEKMKEREALEDEKIRVYQQQKDAREAALEEAKEQAQKAKEIELMRMLRLQEASSDTLAVKHALRAKRQQDDIERAQRKKDLEAIEIQRKKSEEVSRILDKQVRDQEQLIAIQSRKDREDFMRILNKHEEANEADKAAKKAAHEQAIRNVQEVQLQIKQKEKERLMARKNFFEEGIKLNEEANERRNRLDRIKERKVQELRVAGVEEQYLHGVKRLAHTKA